VNLAMMAAAKWDGEFVAHFAPEGTQLREPNVMRIGKPAPVDQTSCLATNLRWLLSRNIGGA
jgi:hypothetical protein